MDLEGLRKELAALKQRLSLQPASGILREQIKQAVEDQTEIELRLSTDSDQTANPDQTVLDCEMLATLREIESEIFEQLVLNEDLARRIHALEVEILEQELGTKLPSSFLIPAVTPEA